MDKHTWRPLTNRDGHSTQYQIRLKGGGLVIISLHPEDHLLRLKSRPLWMTSICPGAAGAQSASPLPDLIFSIIHSPTALPAPSSAPSAWATGKKKKKQGWSKRRGLPHLVPSWALLWDFSRAQNLNGKRRSSPVFWERWWRKTCKNFYPTTKAEFISPWKFSRRLSIPCRC